LCCSNHDQWQEFMDVYVRDKHNLGLKPWFEQHNPHALAQSIERMIEAARLGQWQADPKALAELLDRYRDLALRHAVRSDNAVFEQFVAQAGFGLAAPQPEATAAQARAEPHPAQPAPAPVPPAPTAPPIEGLRLEQVPPRPQPPAVLPLAGLALLLLSLLGGAARAWRHPVLGAARAA